MLFGTPGEDEGNRTENRGFCGKDKVSGRGGAGGRKRTKNRTGDGRRRAMVAYWGSGVERGSRSATKLEYRW